MKRLVGLAIILLSAPIYRMTATSFILVTIFGWTSDSPYQPFLEHLYIRFVNGLFFVSNVSLSLAGIQIFRNKIKVFTYLCLIFGLWSAVSFYGKLYSHYTSPDSRLQRGDVHDTIDYYSKIIDTGKKDSDYEKRGEIYYGIGEYKKALFDFNTIKDYKCIILTYIKLNDFENALTACDEWATVEALDSYRAYLWKGNIYYKQGNYEKAIEAYKKSSEFEKQRFDDKPWTKDGADDLDYIRLSYCYAKLGNFLQAEEYLEKAFSMANEYFKANNNDAGIAGVLVAKGNFYNYIGDLSKAKATYKEALQRNRFCAIRMIPREILDEMAINHDIEKIEDKDPSGKIYNDMQEMDSSIPPL